MTAPQKPRWQQLVEQVSSVRNGLLSIHEELGRTEVVGEAGNGLVRVTVRGTGEVIAVQLDPGVKRENPAALEELFLTAAQQAQAAARTLVEQKAAPLSQLNQRP
jgi:nucleoid-associated protein EbfC